MSDETSDLLGRWFRFKCKCGGEGSDECGCGLLSDGAVVEYVGAGAHGNTVCTGQFRLILGWYSGHQGAPRELFCRNPDPAFCAGFVGYAEPSEDGEDRVYIDWESLAPLEESYDADQ